MPIIYSVRLKASQNASLDKIREVMTGWISGSNKSSVDIVQIGNSSSHSEALDKSAYVSTATAFHPDTNVRCIAVRTSTDLFIPDNSLPRRENLHWQAEMISEETADGIWFTINLSRSSSSADMAADLEWDPIPPRIIALLIENELLESDMGLPFSLRAQDGTMLSDDILSAAINGDTLSIMPIVVVSESKQPFCDILTGILRGTAHILLLSDSHPLRGHAAPEQVQLFYPRAKVSRIYTLDDKTAHRILRDVLRLTYFAAPCKILTFDMVQYWSILQGGKRTDHTPKSGYICINPAMAEAMRFQRKKSGLTQAELGEKVGSTGLIISRIENNKTTRVAEQTMNDIENVLGLEVGALSSMESLQSSLPEEKPASQELSQTHAFCYKCGTKLLDGSLFCHACGIKLPR